MGEFANEDALKELERFVVDNDELLQLEERIGRFNIFDALGIVNNEIRHSNFLAWLLDPGESHGLGPLFLNAVLMDLLRQTAPEHRLFSPIRLDGGELRGVQVRREWNHIDLLITCDDPSFVIAIENKIYSGEHSDQLSRYAKIVSETPELAKHKHRQFVFLTREGDEPSEDGWTIYSYAHLHRVLTKVRGASAEQMSVDVREFLDHYLRMIGSRFMDDEKIDELCRTIYQNHRQAIDLIFERGLVGLAGSIVDELAAILRDSQIKWFVFTRTGRRLDFVPEAWLSWLPDNSALPGQHPKYWLRWFVDVNEKSRFFRLYVEVSPCRDAKLRARIIERLTSDPAEFGLRVQAAKGVVTDRFTRLYSERLGQWSEKDEPSPSALVRSGWDKIAKLHSRLAGVADALSPVIRQWESENQA